MADEAKKILLVEDDPMVIRMYQRKLEFEGFKVTLAFNGEEGLEALKKETPNIILLDVMMPKMNGIETLKAIRSDEKYKALPIIILTNLGDRPEDVQKCKDLGATDYMVKANLQLKDLVEKLKGLIG
jgi:CheY-like chemotaxis protein